MEAKTPSGSPSGTPPVKPATPPQPDDLVPQATVIEHLKTKFSDAVLNVKTILNQNFIFVNLSSLVGICQHLKDAIETRYNYLVDITAVDLPKAEKRFEVIYVLYSHARNDRLFIKVQLSNGETVPSVSGVWAVADWLEREVFDMFGIEFSGHPDLKRILLPEGWHGFPLRKDYPIALQDEEWINANMEILK